MAAAQQLLLTCLLAGSCYSVRSVLLGSGSAVRQTPTSYYVPFQTVGADYLQAGDKRATFQYNNPFQKTGCDNPAAVRALPDPPQERLPITSPVIAQYLNLSSTCTLHAGLQRRDGHHDVRLPGAEDRRGFRGRRQRCGGRLQRFLLCHAH